MPRPTPFRRTFGGLLATAVAAAVLTAAPASAAPAAVDGEYTAEATATVSASDTGFAVATATATAHRRAGTMSATFRKRAYGRTFKATRSARIIMSRSVTGKAGTSALGPVMTATETRSCTAATQWEADECAESAAFAAALTSAQAASAAIGAERAEPLAYAQAYEWAMAHAKIKLLWAMPTRAEKRAARTKARARAKRVVLRKIANYR